MSITFYGAAREVTGSCSLLETGRHKILVDCGMFQGGAFNESKNHDPLPFNPKELTQVLVTHAHLDHVGRLPLLIKGGYTGTFYATPATIELAELIMDDALEVMTYDHRKFGRSILYDSTDIANVMAQFKPVDYYEEIFLDDSSPPLLSCPAKRGEERPGEDCPLSKRDEPLTAEPKANPSVKERDSHGALRSASPLGKGRGRDDVRVKFYDAGHIFGSAFIEIQAEGKRIVFSGDIGNVNVPILRDTDILPENVDALVCESTYGNRLHESTEERQTIIEQMFREGVGDGGVLMIPSFSLERTQELIYELNDLIDRKHQLPRVPIFLDSPLAINALKVYRKYHEYYNEEATRLFHDGDDMFQFPGLTMCQTKEESKRINQVPPPKVIIAGAGMMNGGRIVHHALRYLSDDKSTLLIIGYQAEGTLGREILDGAKKVNVLGESVQVRCRIKAIGALSAHADQNKLLDWMGGGPTIPKKVYLNHGEPDAAESLAKRLASDLNVKATVVNFGLRVEV